MRDLKSRSDQPKSSDSCDWDRSLPIQWVLRCTRITDSLSRVRRASSVIGQYIGLAARRFLRGHTQTLGRLFVASLFEIKSLDQNTAGITPYLQDLSKHLLLFSPQHFFFLSPGWIPWLFDLTFHDALLFLSREGHALPIRRRHQPRINFRAV